MQHRLKHKQIKRKQQRFTKNIKRKSKDTSLPRKNKEWRAIIDSKVC